MFGVKNSKQVHAYEVDQEKACGRFVSCGAGLKFREDGKLYNVIDQCS